MKNWTIPSTTNGSGSSDNVKRPSTFGSGSSDNVKRPSTRQTMQWVWSFSKDCAKPIRRKTVHTLETAKRETHQNRRPASPIRRPSFEKDAAATSNPDATTYATTPSLQRKQIRVKTSDTFL
ncbi:hypothetical protein CEXT_703391 [Caerostris extrusa]|uniref:Uncharacterized protein n=1 Tax=Caerostris extrusa TaxID=172846 RepID=A0AAV4NNQ5_CAEEX|nr:hypothetical protein CEXT_703391 [Caerostris extrusa]